MATTRTQPAKLPKLPYPESRKHDAAYWLAVWFCEQSKLEAVDAHFKKIFLKASNPLTYGLIRALGHLKNDADTTLNFVISEGQLLMAWHGTSVLKTGVPA